MAKRKDKNESDLNNENSSEDNFGLPDIEYKPLETETTVQPESEQEPVEEPVRQSYTYTPEEEPRSNAPIIIAVIIGLVLVVGGFLLYQYVYMPQKEKEKRELAAKQDAEKKRREEEARLAREKEEEERRRREEEAANAVVKPTTGTIETLSSRTNRYYVVIASAVDGDLLMDQAKKLSTGGVSTKIIPPFGKWKFYRLTISDFDSFAAAQTNADSSKPEFGEGAWVIRY
ncbi:MAG: hypothetical protein KIT62_14070 [Cyclobacteriaceae bacterium]|nr:hypothetical protein [Cyclobacteriaceae bacterium]